jgi:Fe2+ or Zn2+ uptake regulation protein
LQEVAISMDSDYLFPDQLRSRGFRMTPQRLAILRVLYETKQHLTPLQVYERAKKLFPRVTEPTVYRSLEFLAKNGLALAGHLGNGKLVYEIAGRDHHHVICGECAQEMEIPHEQLEELYRHIELSTGYRLTSGHLTFWGLCPHCR